jgi:hypothetical protein
MFKLIHYSSFVYCTKDINVISQHYIYQLNYKGNVLAEPLWFRI